MCLEIYSSLNPKEPASRQAGTMESQRAFHRNPYGAKKNSKPQTSNHKALRYIHKLMNL